MDDRRKKHSSSLDLMDRIVQAQPFTSESLLKARMKAAARGLRVGIHGLAMGGLGGPSSPLSETDFPFGPSGLGGERGETGA